MTITYNGGKPKSGLGATQLNPHFYERKALIEVADEMIFSQLADTKTMPKNSGTEIKQYRHIPVIDDRNIGGEGIDAKGVTYANGNLYGSSTDVGFIADKFPTLGELGGRVNKIDFTRVELKSNLKKYGMFYEYSADSENFDSEADIVSRATNHLMDAAVKTYEDNLQIDLLNNAGLVKYAGVATTNTELAAGMVLTYPDLVKLGIDLDKSKTPKNTEIITGTRMIDTKTISACRVAYVGSEMLTTLQQMKDYHNNPAFIPAHQYAAGTTLLKGEVGRIADFRIIVAPRMFKWAGKGATASDKTYYNTNGNYDVFPFLVVGDKAFTTIGFQTDGKSNKFTTIHKMPGTETADRTDPYGESGFSSVKWWYGFMPQFIERLAVLKCVAKM